MIQIDMDMPKNCDSCRLAAYSEGSVYCAPATGNEADSKTVFIESGEERPKWCPLKEEKKETFSVLVRKSSDWDYEEVREFRSLEECFETLAKKHKSKYKKFVVESRKTSWVINQGDHQDKNASSCKWCVEIYDALRE